MLSAAELERVSGVRVRAQVLGSTVTTYAIGGPLQYLVEPDSCEQLAAVQRFLSEHGEAARVLGAGSNLLINDGGVPGWVIRLGRGLRGCEALGGGRFRVGGGAALMNLSRSLSQAGWAGLEFAGGIPASIGGATRMNAGAHGGEMAQVLRVIEVVTSQGETLRLDPLELCFSYRHSQLPAGAIVSAVEIELTESDAAVTEQRRAEYLAHRKKYQPLTLPSAGSVFKNPDPQRPAGKLIEAAGLKGQRRGGAQISELHGNWIVNPERKASAADVEALIALCQERVGERLEVELVRW